MEKACTHHVRGAEQLKLRAMSLTTGSVPNARKHVYATYVRSASNVHSHWSKGVKQLMMA